MQFREIRAVYSKNHMKSINVLLIFKAGNTHTYTGLSENKWYSFKCTFL
jgi:hypothetical protein